MNREHSKKLTMSTSDSIATFNDENHGGKSTAQKQSSLVKIITIKYNKIKGKLMNRPLM